MPSLFAQMFWHKEASHFRRIGVSYVQKYRRPYIELFRLPNWYGTLHYDPSTVELSLWNDKCVVHEVNNNALSIKVLHVTDDFVPITVDDISDKTLSVWRDKTNANITFASGLGFSKDNNLL